MKLKELYENHKQLELPNFPENDDFADWLEELIEIDDYYMGIVASSIGSEKPKINFDEINKLTTSLNKFASIEEDVEIFKKCKIYLDSLRTLLEKASK